MDLHRIFREATLLGALFLGLAIFNHGWSADSAMFPTTAGYIAMALGSLVVAVVAGFYCQRPVGKEDADLDRLAVAVGVMAGADYQPRGVHSAA